jgi:hypothetical protein
MNKQTNESNLVIFLDSIGRSILGEKVKSTETNLVVKNPVILHIVPDNSGRMSVQLMPLFFREFLADKNEDVQFYFQLEKIVESDIKSLDFRLQAQYNQLFNKNSVFVPPQEESSDKVVKLFDEE